MARRVLGRYAPGTRRASGPVPVIADVRRKYEDPHQAPYLCFTGNALGCRARDDSFRIVAFDRLDRQATP